MYKGREKSAINTFGLWDTYYSSSHNFTLNLKIILMDRTSGSLFKQGFFLIVIGKELKQMIELDYSPFFFTRVSEKSSNGFSLSCFIKKLSTIKPFDSL